MKTAQQISAWAHAEAVRTVTNAQLAVGPESRAALILLTEQAILHGYSQGASDMAAALRVGGRQLCEGGG